MRTALQARCVDQHLTAIHRRTSYDVDEIDELWIAKDSRVLDSRSARQSLREQLAATLRDRDARE